MATTRRFVAPAVAAALLSFAALADGPPAPRPALRAHPTVEPTLPLLIEARFQNVERGPGAVSAVLVVEITASDEIRDLELETTLPAGLGIVDGDLPPHGPLRLARGEVRRFAVPVRGEDSRRQAVRIEAVFRDAAGHELKLGQGATLDPVTPAAGRSHLGAYEVMAVPIEELPK
jgi:hypothetical protein